MSTSRRVFMMQMATAASAVLVAQQASAQAMVAENDPQAAGVGYKADASKVDKAKYPKYAAGQNCSNCALYQGKAGAASACSPGPRAGGIAPKPGAACTRFFFARNPLEPAGTHIGGRSGKCRHQELIKRY
jgi:High potential iron-sulfur protein